MPDISENKPAHPREAAKTNMPSVVGFLFDDPVTSVVLIEKKRPEWQKGLLNGPGGKIKNGETPETAMAREFFEETNLWIPPGMWREFARMTCDNSDIETICFTAKLAVATYLRDMVRNGTDEKVIVLPVHCITVGLPTIPSVQWLVPLALDTNKTAHIIRTC